MEPFEYTALPSEDHIRIIELLPGEYEDKIEFELSVERRDQCKGPYDAISYVWGNKNKLVKTVCCDKSMHITKNLYVALQTIRARRPGEWTRLWADAISIDQENIQEKNHQVKKMGHVYKNARQVHIWLGPDKYGLANDTFKLVQAHNQLFYQYNAPSKVPSTFVDHDLLKDAERGERLARLLHLPWFQRVWVVQEVALSTCATLHWGHASLDFAELVELACFYNGGSNVLKWLGGPRAELLFLRILFQCVYRTYGRTASWGNHANWYFKGPKGPGKHAAHSGLFLDILVISKALQASNVRDHVYAFLGNLLAVGDDGELLIEPDYRKTEEQVSLDLTEALLRCAREAPYVLCFVQHSSAEDVTRERALSWLQHWKNEGTDRKLTFTIGNIGLNFKAGGSVENLQFEIQDNRILVVPGLIFDELWWASELLHSGNFALDSERWDDDVIAAQQPYIEMLLEEVKLAYTQCMGPEHTWDPIQHKDDFGYTLVTGYNNQEDISPKHHASIFSAYRRVVELQRTAPKPTHADHIVSSKQRNKASRFERDMQNCEGRRFGVFKSGRLALIPKFAKKGDVCAILAGMATPFILRHAEAHVHGKGYHHFVGEAYVRGVMRGELAVDLDEVKIDIKLI